MKQLLSYRAATGVYRVTPVVVRRVCGEDQVALISAEAKCGQ